MLESITEKWLALGSIVYVSEIRWRNWGLGGLELTVPLQASMMVRLDGLHPLTINIDATARRIMLASP